MRKAFWLGGLRGRDHSEDLGGDGSILLKMDIWEIGFRNVD
jgi:hypothetical protein